MGWGSRGRARGSNRNNRTARHSREKAARWWSNLLAKQTAEKMAELREME